MEVTYLSHFIERKTPLYGGNKGLINFNNFQSISNGDTSNSLKICMPNHVGTHIDFPRHFNNKAKSSSDYPASFWIFQNVGFIHCNVDQIESFIEELDLNIEILILKTDFGLKRTHDDYIFKQPVIKSSLATIFKKRFKKLRVFGFDMISLTSKIDREEGKRAHLNFLIENEILILEDMKLDMLDKKPDKVIILPLQLLDVDGSPCNVICINETK